MLLERTPYNTDVFVDGTKRHLRDAVHTLDRDWVDAGYILVIQDVRGKFGSEGFCVMTQPPRGPLNTTTTDDTTAAFDTVDWLSNNVARSNGRVNMVRSSYDGWAVAMALLGLTRP